MDATINIKGRRTSRHHGRRASLPSREAGVAPSAALHLPMANACGVAFDLFDVAEIFKKTPYVADLKPGGRYVAKDMLEIGGIAESAIRKVAGMSNLKFTQKFTKKFTWDGETIEIDAGVGGLDVKLTATELSKTQDQMAAARDRAYVSGVVDRCPAGGIGD